MAFDITYAVISLFLIPTQRCLAKCETRFHEHETKCYRFIEVASPSKAKFQTAVDLCNTHDATLPEPRSQAEFDLWTRFPSLKNKEYWLGVKGLGLDPNQRTFSYISDNTTVCYNGWRISEAQSSDPEQAVCTIVNKGGRWEDRKCDQSLNYVVCETISCPNEYTRKGKKCYKLIGTDRKNFQDAQSTCEDKHHGWLAEPKSMKEKTDIIKIIKSTRIRSEFLWLGAKHTTPDGKQYTEGTWWWQRSREKVNTDVLDFSNDSYTECLVINEDEEWGGHIECSSEKSFICEYHDLGTRDCGEPQEAINDPKNQTGIDDPEDETGIDDPENQKKIIHPEKQKGISCESVPYPCGHGRHICISLPDSQYTCECEKGYTLGNKSHPTCTEVNKCGSTKDICHSADGTDHKCVNTPASKYSYRCDCQKGYENVDDRLCAPIIIDGPKPRKPFTESLPDIPEVKAVVATISLKIILFIIFTVVMDVRLFFAVIYRFCTTEPVPDSDSDDYDDEEDLNYVSKSQSKYWQSGNFVLERGENIWSVRGKVFQDISVEDSRDISLEDISNHQIYSVESSRTPSNLTMTSSTESTISRD